ncbi:MAG: ABC transporter ATP-binding protein [Betaproteobacteria bacterium]
MATVDLQGLTKRYDPQAPPAVDGLDLHIDHGELVALLGPSGCGKTTTLRMLGGFIAPDAGEIRVGNRVIASPSVMVPPERRNMSMIFQSYAIWPHKTVYENVAYGLKFRDVSRSQADRKVHDMLGVVKLEHLAHRYPNELSGGQQQRVALARALVVEPEILLLDEPLSNLDANLREEMRFEIRRLHDKFQITSVYVTHDQAEAMVIADRICVMNQGRIAQIGTPKDVYELPRTRFAASFIGKTNLLEGQLNGSEVDLGEGVMLPVAEKLERSVNGHALVCVRPHNIRLFPPQADAGALTAKGFRAYAGRVSQRFYFGDNIDYQVNLSRRANLRVITSPAQNFSVGDAVQVLIHPSSCVAVRDD